MSTTMGRLAWAAATALTILTGCASTEKFDTLDLLDQKTYLVFYTAAMAEGQSSKDFTAAVDAYRPAAIYVGGADGWTHASALEEAPSESDVAVAARSYGLVHLGVVNDTAALRESARVTSLVEAMAQTRRPWRVLLLPQTVIGESVDPATAQIARMLERLGVTLAIAPGGKCYVRSEPIGSGPANAVRYVSLPTATLPEADTCPVRPWIARTVPGARYAVLEATLTRLRWSLYDEQSRLLDLLEIRRDDSSAQPSKTRSVGEILAQSRYLEETP